MNAFQRCGQCEAVHPVSAPCQGNTLPGRFAPPQLAESQWQARSAAPAGLAVVETQAGPADAAPRVERPRFGTPLSLLGSTVGSFKLTRLLGSGGMGEVFLGEHPVIGSKVAVKFLRQELCSQEEIVQRFFSEARAATTIGHENIVSIFDLSILPPGRYYIVMEFLEGQTLGALSRDGPMAPEDVLPLLIQACKALQCAHEHGIIHRDIKPDNIFVVERPNRPQFVKIVDFGVSKLRAGSFASHRTVTGDVLGTPDYMAPEQWRGQDTDGRADMYALGMVAYRLVTGRLPFTVHGLHELLYAHLTVPPPDPREFNPALSGLFAEAILRALAKEPDARFVSMSELAGALSNALAQLGVGSGRRTSSTQIPVVTPVGRSVRRKLGMPAMVRPRGSAVITRTVCMDISRGGAFLEYPGEFPPLFSAQQLEFPDVQLTLDCQVVRHFTLEEARAWGKPAGIGVEFVGVRGDARVMLDQLIQGLPAPTPLHTPAATGNAGDAAAVEFLGRYAKRIRTDPYDLLGLRADAEGFEVRQMGRRCTEEVVTLRAQPLSPAVAAQLDELLRALRDALVLLGDAEQRAVLDASRGNFRGVARCLAAGLSLSRLAELRREFLARRPGNEEKAREHIFNAMQLQARNQLAPACLNFERALSSDPLNAELHQRYWKLKRLIEALPN